MKDHRHKHDYRCPAQPAPVKHQMQFARRELTAFAMKRIVAQGKLHDKAMKTPPAWPHSGGGDGGMPESQVLLDMNIRVLPDTDPMTGFPAGTKATDLANYQNIARAFSRCFQPGLFSEMGLATDPYGGFPAGTVYWQHFFNDLRPDGFVVDVSKGNSTCLGVDGETNGFSYIQIYDCTPEADIFHEIGHLVLDSGVKKKWKPIYYHYTEGGFIPVGGQAAVFDAWTDFDRLFGDRKMDNKPVDPDDNVHFGFVSDYAEKNEEEDFADCFKYYVYYPRVFWDKAARQTAAGFPLLDQKATYMAQFFRNLYFADGGIPANWYGFPI